MNENKPNHTPAPWRVIAGDDYHIHAQSNFETRTSRFGQFNMPSPMICEVSNATPDYGEANAHLIAAAPDLLAEMQRYLPVLERIEEMPSMWAEITEETGVATLNGYRAAIAKAKNTP